jgi:hypothetical protein
LFFTFIQPVQNIHACHISGWFIIHPVKFQHPVFYPG